VRTTLTLEPDAAKQVRELMDRDGIAMKRAVNELIIRGGAVVLQENEEPPFVVKTWPGGYAPGVDPNKAGQYADELEAEEILRKMRS